MYETVYVSSIDQTRTRTQDLVPVWKVEEAASLSSQSSLVVTDVELGVAYNEGLFSKRQDLLSVNDNVIVFCLHFYVKRRIIIGMPMPDCTS
jgi:hypothetical protein